MNGQPVQPEDGQAPQTVGASGGVGSNPAAPSAPGAAPKATSSGMTGFQNYQKANQGAATDNLSGAVNKNVANQGQQAKTGINQATTSFGQKVDTGTLANRENAVTDVKSAVDAARNITSGGQVAQPQQSRFQEVINSKYQGPESLRQSGEYGKALTNVNKASTAIDQTKNAQGREELLKGIYSQGGGYTQGQNKLDAGILNASQNGINNLQNTAKAQGDIRNQLDQAQIASANLAQNRTNEINNIRNQARDTYTQGKGAEEAATESRLSSVIKDWDTLPEYFKNLIRNKEQTSKGMLDQQLSDIKSQNNYDTTLAGYNEKKAAADAAQNSLKEWQPRGADYMNGVGPSDPLQDWISRNTTQTGDFWNQQTHVPTRAEAQAAFQAATDQAAAANQALSPYQQQKSQVDKLLSDAQDSYNPNATYLNSAEAKILGVNPGEGLYNLGADAIKTSLADKNKLISKDEFARQQAIAALGGLDQSKLLDTNTMYNDANAAGTQSALDALDTAGTRAGLNEAEKNFRTDALGNNITGYGNKKNKSSGKRYYAQESANLGDVLKSAGYNFDSNLSNNVGDRGLLNAISNVDTNGMVTKDPSGIAGALDATVSPTANMGDGQSAAQNLLDMYGTGTGLNALTGALGMGSVGNAIGGAFGFGGARASESRADAAGFARADLQNKINQAIDSSGFKNRVGVTDNAVTNQRLTALQQLLANLDKTNS